MSGWRRYGLAWALGAFLIGLAAAPLRAQETPVKRLIVALYNSADERVAQRTRVHRLATMPLNHLGYVVKLYDVTAALPPDADMAEAAAILTWFSDTAVSDSTEFLNWLDRHTAAGVKLLMFGHPGIDLTRLDALANRRLFDRIFARLGLAWRGDWVAHTYGVRIVDRDRFATEFERAYPPVLPSYYRVAIAAPNVKAYLTLQREGAAEPDHLAVTGPGGAYVAWSYAAFQSDELATTRAWYLNPFLFFRAALGADAIPKPDTTTLSGRRIYYSHVDGDAWQNQATLESYRGRSVNAAQVLLEQVIAKYPDLPITIAPVTADLDLSWYGDKQSLAQAREIFQLPNVEIGSHTHSHPLAWGFFRNPDPRREAPYLPRYPARPGKSQAESVWDPRKELAGSAAEPPRPGGEGERVGGLYERPRTYAVRPFDLALEIEGSKRFIEREVAPKDKKVAVMQWSGDTTPWPEVIARTRAAGMRNINGGDPRMDGEFLSYGWLSPIVRQVGDQWQVYSSGANENIYTDNWRGRYFAYRDLAIMLRNSETPIRVKPINLYYHFYLVEREDGLYSLLHNIAYARGRPIAPVRTSEFAAMADGFVSARIVRLGERRWRIENRDGLETIRFDAATDLAVDFDRSAGVIGQRHLQGSLYVALDRAAQAPIIALRQHGALHRDPDATRTYLVQSRWRVEELRAVPSSWTYRATGFGSGEFAWKTEPGRYRVEAEYPEGRRESQEAVADENGLLSFVLAAPGHDGAAITVRRIGAP